MRRYRPGDELTKKMYLHSPRTFDNPCEVAFFEFERKDMVVWYEDEDGTKQYARLHLNGMCSCSGGCDLGLFVDEEYPERRIKP